MSSVEGFYFFKSPINFLIEIANLQVKLHCMDFLNSLNEWRTSCYSVGGA